MKTTSKINLYEGLKEQLIADDVSRIHIRDGVSVDILLSGEYSTDLDTESNSIELKKEWFLSLKSDYSYYKNIENDCLNISYTQLELLV